MAALKKAVKAKKVTKKTSVKSKTKPAKGKIKKVAKRAVAQHTKTAKKGIKKLVKKAVAKSTNVTKKAIRKHAVASGTRKKAAARIEHETHTIMKPFGDMAVAVIDAMDDAMHTVMGRTNKRKK